MKRLLELLLLLLIVLFSFTVIAQELGSLRKGIEIYFPEKIQNPFLDPLPAGTYSVGIGGQFPTIDSAFNKLSIDGIAGNVILELIDNLYTAPTNDFGFFLNGPIAGSGQNSRVTIKPTANKNVTIEGNGLATVTFLNTSYVTIDGISLTGATTLTIHTLSNNYFSYNDGLDFLDNSDYNVIQNIIFINESYTMASGSGFFVLPGGPGAPDGNLIQNNFVKQAGIALFVNNYYGAPTRAKDNIIKGNKIGSETDSLIAFGIQLEMCKNAIVENNIVQNLRFTYPLGYNPGIIATYGSGDIIRNNVVHNIKVGSGFNAVGILLYGELGNIGSNNQVYNNMVYDIQGSSTNLNSRVTGIQMWCQDSLKIYYNSVYLSGIGANFQGSAALFIDFGCTNIDARNNILVNTRDESPYCASVIYDYDAFNLTSDYNDLYYEQNGNNCLVRAGRDEYLTLADWQATGKDSNSVTEMPNFIDPYLHINETIGTYLESGATPIVGIDSDFDGELRNVSTPDIGADEFSGFTPVELTSFTATANGKEIILNWSTATEANNQGFKIERSRDNINFNNIGFVPGFGTTTEPKSYSYSDQSVNVGINYYRLKQVDYDGSYEYSDVVEIDFRTVNSYLLKQCYPNPFNPTTTIGFGIQNKSNVKIAILNSIGEEVAVVLNEEKEPGFHQVEFNATNLPSGVYFYQFKAGDFVETKKMVLLK